MAQHMPFGELLPIHICLQVIVTDIHVAAGPCVINVYINYERKFAFVELRTGIFHSFFISASCAF